MLSQNRPSLLSLSVPRSTEWDGTRASQFMHQMLMGFDALIFRILATSQNMVWQISDPQGANPESLASAIRASYPEANVAVEEFGVDELPSAYPLYRIVLKYQQVMETFLAPIMYASDIRSPDPLSHVTEAMSYLREGERITYYLFVAGSAPEVYKQGEKHLSRNIYDGTLTGFVDPYKVERFNPEATRVCRAKLSQRLYHASVFIQIDTPDQQRLHSLLAIDNQMVNFDRPQYGCLGWIDDGQKFWTVSDDDIEWECSALGQYAKIVTQEDGLFRKNKLKQQIDLILEPRELAALWHLPHEEFTASTIQWAYGTVRLPSAMRGKFEGVCVGVNSFAGREEPIHIPDRTGHISIVGRTGVGKTTLMHHLIHQDIEAGRGVAVIDPHGQLVNDTLRYSIPTHREKDVVVLDLADEDFPLPLNLLSMPSGIDRGNAAAQLMGILDRMYDFNSTPTVADTMWASLVTLLQDDAATVRDVGRLFKDEVYRERLLSQVTNVAALEYWERFSQQTGSKDQFIRPVLWRLRALYGNSVLYPIVCHPRTLDFASLIAQNKIVLLSLKADERRIPLREQHLIGLILLTQIQQAVMARRPGSTPYHLYVDEVQHFVTTTFDTLLSEARKYGLSLTTANQYFKQLAGNTLDAIIGNVGTMIVFQTGLDDAKLLAPYLSPGFDDDHLMHLNAYEAAIVTRYKTQSLPAFSLKTHAPLSLGVPQEKADARERYIRHLSRRTYTPTSRAEVLNWLLQRYGESKIRSGGSEDIVDFE